MDILELNEIGFIEYKEGRLVLRSCGAEGYVRFTMKTHTKLEVLIGTETLRSLTVCVNGVYNSLDYYKPEIKDGYSRFEIVMPSCATVGIHFT